MEASNLRLIQLLNQKQFKEEKIKGAIQETRRKIESLKAESKDTTRQSRIHECEQVEAQILMTNESYKLLEVEKKRMEVIIQALIKNPANNSEYTNMVEQSSEQINKLIAYEKNVTKEAKLKTEEYAKEINKTTEHLEKRIKLRNHTYSEISKYLEKISKKTDD